jgi:hypothetical protein
MKGDDKNQSINLKQNKQINYVFFINEFKHKSK